MLSAEMLSWMFGAMRFSSIARICEARTPMTVTVDNSAVCSASLPVSLPAALDLAFLDFGDGVVASSCGEELCVPGLAAGAPVPGDAMAGDTVAASNATDTAIDTGCLRCRLDTGFTS